MMGVDATVVSGWVGCAKPPQRECNCSVYGDTHKQNELHIARNMHAADWVRSPLCV
jgi:hypothetical protein